MKTHEAVELERAGWAIWNEALFSATFPKPYAPHHVDFWDWAWAIEHGTPPDPFIAVWPRGHAKSTSAETMTVQLGARGLRSYALYVCEIQDLADQHVAAIGGKMESPEMEFFYPEMADRAVGKFGAAKAWRRNRLWTASGFVVDALGLDVAARGRKILDQRPDTLILDEIDSDFDTPIATQKKLTSISRKLLPALTDDAVIAGVQNLVIAGGVFAQLAGVAA